jgi:CheY-like chemotaxis protein
VALTPHSPKVLLVQRHDDNRSMYAEFLRHHNFNVGCPADVAEALVLAAGADVIVTGLLLPGPLDGFEFITRLRRDAATKEKPIIVLTAWAWQTERLRAEEAGCDVFLTKPCLPHELLRQVRRVVALAKPRRPRAAKSAADGRRARKRPA